MRTVVVSDLHLGLRAGGDLGRRPDVRARLVELLAGADRLVLLGDVLELRERTLTEATVLARPLFEELAGALAGGEIVLVPGNHDHALVGALASAYGGADRLRSLEQRWAPPPEHPLGRLAGQLGSASVELAYPGLWLADGVYATHGHYMDAHSPVPMVECLAIALSARLRGGPPAAGSTPADYERILAPVYRFSEQTGRRQSLGRGGAGDISVRLYERMTRRAPDAETGHDARAGGDRAATAPSPQASGSRAAAVPDLGDRLVRGAIPPAVRALNRLGLGPFNADVSGTALRRAGLVAMGEVVRRLEIGADHVIFGHTHRPGPLPRDLGEWTVPAEGGRGPTRLMNTGSWVYAPLFLGSQPSDSPYWPGRCVVVEEGRPPQLLHPLADSDHAQLAQTR